MSQLSPTEGACLPLCHSPHHSLLPHVWPDSLLNTRCRILLDMRICSPCSLPHSLGPQTCFFFLLKVFLCSDSSRPNHLPPIPQAWLIARITKTCFSKAFSACKCSHANPPATVSVRKSKESLRAYRTKSHFLGGVVSPLHPAQPYFPCSLSDHCVQGPVPGTNDSSMDKNVLSPRRKMGATSGTRPREGNGPEVT